MTIFLGRVNDYFLTAGAETEAHFLLVVMIRE